MTGVAVGIVFLVVVVICSLEVSEAAILSDRRTLAGLVYTALTHVVMVPYVGGSQWRPRNSRKLRSTIRIIGHVD